MIRHRALCGFVVLVALASCSDPATSPHDLELDALAGKPTEVIDLGTLGGSESYAWDINDQGVVVGGSELPDGSMHAFRWTRETGMHDLGTLGGSSSNAVAINRRGVIAGTSSDAAGVTHLVAWNPRGEIRDLGIAPDHPLGEISPVDMNSRNEIVGDYFSLVGHNRVFHWTERSGIKLYAFHRAEGYAGGVNMRGDVVGMFCCGQAQNYGAFFAERGEGFLDLGGITNWTAAAAGINDHRMIVGWDEHNPTIQPFVYLTAPFRWTAKDGFEVLGSLGGDDGAATAVNNRGEVVGTSAIASAVFVQHAFYWNRERGMVDLGPGRPAAIDNRGRIVGTITGASGARATMWVGTRGLAAQASTSRAGIGTAKSNATQECFGDRVVVRSKGRLLRCLQAKLS